MALISLVSGCSPYTRPSEENTTPRLRSMLVVVAAAVRFRLTRFEIAEDSMEPALHSGDWVYGVKRPSRVKVGDVIVVEHPHRPGFRVVKRVAAIDKDGLVVRGDHAGHSEDSRTFGPVPQTSVVARLVLVYHPRPLRAL